VSSGSCVYLLEKCFERKVQKVNLGCLCQRKMLYCGYYGTLLIKVYCVE
jgi:hypothetical protein